MSITIPTSTTSLEDKIHQAGGPLALLRDSKATTATGPLTGAEFSNWRDEERAWRHTSALLDLSHHMVDLTVRGPDKLKLLSDLGVNSLANFAVGRAKQFVAVNADGYVIGDAILDYLDEDTVLLIGTAAVPNWVQYHIETGDYDVTFERDEPTASNPAGHPALYRFQVQGPTALDVITKAATGPVPEIKFFHTGELTIAGKRVRAIGHGMSRQNGMELTGPWADSPEILAALLDAGEEFGLVRVGSRAPTAATLESGWLPAPIPAIFTGEEMEAYRAWLPASGFEATSSIGGSFTPPDISYYYLRPSDIGYAKLVKFDHDFIGREALERGVDGPQRRKVTLAWNTEDVLKAIGTMFEQGDPAKYMDFPISSYSTWPYDEVRLGARLVGVSTISGYTYNERRSLSLAVIDEDVEIGTEVVVVWGEKDGGSHKPQVERHVQTHIRAIVSAVPYTEVPFTAESVR